MSNVPAKQTWTGACVDLTYEGLGVLKVGKETIFVEGMFPGDEGEVAFDYKRAGILYGKIVKLHKLSPSRINPECKICHACGGCVFQQYDYQTELEFKTKKVKEQFRKVGHMDVDVLPCIGMENPRHYRNKIQMPFGKDNRGNVYCGFYKQGTHVIVPVKDCKIESEKAEPILEAACRLMKTMRVAPYEEDRRFGVIRHLLIRTSRETDEIMVVLVTAVDSFPGRNNFVKALLKECPQISTVIQNINSRQTNVILGERERILYGKGYIEDSLCGLKFRISPKSFFQTNPVTTEKLYSYAIKAAKLTQEDIAFDAYSGIGTIGLIAAKECGLVVSVELVGAAVRDGKLNAERNGIKNFQMYKDDASSFMVRVAEKGQHVDVLFMDPPRKGSDQRFLDALLKLKPSRVIYVSCDPSTLARDVAYINKSYKIESIQPFDMFPRSFHVETVVSLSLNK